MALTRSIYSVKRQTGVASAQGTPQRIAGAARAATADDAIAEAAQSPRQGRAVDPAEQAAKLGTPSTRVGAEGALKVGVAQLGHTFRVQKRNEKRNEILK
jgi:hypothetical protein